MTMLKKLSHLCALVLATCIALPLQAQNRAEDLEARLKESAEASPAAARKRWIAGTLDPLGRLTVDDGASKALSAGRSLLPAGVVRVEGRFAKGDAVAIVNGANQEIARGLVAYDVDEAARIAGRKSAEIEEVLGYRGRDELIHRDDLVLKGT